MRLKDLYRKDRQEKGCYLLYVGFRSLSLRLGLAQVFRKLFNRKKKELGLCYKLKFSNPYIFAIRWCKPLIFQNYIVWFYRIQSLKYLWCRILGCKDIRIRKSPQSLNFCEHNMLFIYFKIKNNLDNNNRKFKIFDLMMNDK